MLIEKKRKNEKKKKENSFGMLIRSLSFSPISHIFFPSHFHILNYYVPLYMDGYLQDTTIQRLVSTKKIADSIIFDPFLRIQV